MSAYSLRWLRPGLLFLLLVAERVLAQPAGPYRNLVLEGGGLKGIAYGGALEVLAQRGLLADIRRVGGTSAGAIQAALLAVGYAPAEIVTLTQQTPFQQFKDSGFPVIGGGRRLFRQFGWYKGEKFRRYLADLIGRRTGRADLTLGELHDRARQDPAHYRDLYVTGTNLTAQRSEVFSFETYPRMRVADAVRISMSIPLYYRAVLLDSAGNVVSGRPRPGQRVRVLVDGGLLANYPIDLFDWPRYRSEAGGEGKTGAREMNPETLGLRLDRPEQLAYDSAGRRELAPVEVSDFNSYAGALYTLTHEGLNRAALRPDDWRRTVSINTTGVNGRVRKLSDADRDHLLDNGRRAMRAFLERTK